MASIFSTFLRGMVGVAAAILIVAVTWTTYIKRDAVVGAAEPVARLLTDSDAGDTSTEGSTTKEK
jgi:hypothetical protein